VFDAALFSFIFMDSSCSCIRRYVAPIHSCVLSLLRMLVDDEQSWGCDKDPNINRHARGGKDYSPCEDAQGRRQEIAKLHEIQHQGQNWDYESGEAKMGNP
jgi:hypothetical protein